MELSVRREDRPGRPSAARAQRPAEPGRSRLQRAGAGGVAMGMLRVCVHRRGAVATLTLLAAALAAISMNALTRQAGRHPAPLFGTPERVAEAPRMRPAPPATTQTTPAPALRPQTPAPAPAPAAATVPAKRDPIGDLIRGDATTTASLKADGDVRLAQRVLTKLGYGPLKADGVMGAGTRAAIERFEHDRKLPTTGEASGRTLRLLAQLGGGEGGGVKNP